QHALEAMLPSLFEQVEQANQVDARVEHRIGHRAAYVHLCGMMAEDLRPLAAKEVGDAGILDIELIELRLRVEIVALPGRQIIEDRHLMSRRQKCIHQMRADEARASSHQNLHAPSTLSRLRKYSMVCRNPSSRLTRGSHPSTRRACPISGCRMCGSSLVR